MTSPLRPSFPLVLALVFLAFHLVYIPKSLEDLDSVNFALGVKDYDVTQHQPHPPGYPIYILLAKGVRIVAGSEPAALSVLSMFGGALGALAIAALFSRLLGSSERAWVNLGTAAAVTSPLYWFTAARPLSDAPGLAAALGVQVLTLASNTPSALTMASFVAALATGIRSQIAWLTVPLLVMQAFRPAIGGLKLPATFTVVRHRLAAIAAGFVLGVIVWFVPMIVITGGPRAYWGALAFQGSADLGNIQMLWTRHGVRDIADAFYYAFVAPWVTWPTAVVVLTLAAAGLVALVRRSFDAAILLAAAFGPYFVFDLLFQETFTSRYALPLVVPIALLAAAGARLLPWQSGLVVLAAVSVADAHAGGTSVAAFAREKAPAFRLLDDMRTYEQSVGALPVLAMDRKQSFDFRRPFIWVDGALPQFASALTSPPQHEWLEAVKYWNGGGRAPVWFVVDPKRTMMDLVQHGDPVRYRWSLPYPVLVGGARPDEMDFYRVDAPDWFVAEGWALTPEAAGINEVDRRSLSTGRIFAWISRRASGGALMIGGRNFASQPETLTFTAPEPLLRMLQPFSVPPGPFLKFISLAGVALPPTPDYVVMGVNANPPGPVAIEQFDAGVRPIVGYATGWYEHEFNPRTGQQWRWLSERGELRFAAPTPRVALHLEIDDPRTYFSRGSRLIARAGDRVIFDDVLTSGVSLDLPVPEGTAVVTLETDQVFQPADRSRKSADRRHLGLRVFRCEVRPVS